MIARLKAELAIHGEICDTRAAPWNEGGLPGLDAGARRLNVLKEQRMLAFQIIGGIFVFLFLAVAMTSIEGAHGGE